jgi:hypothetical protein
MDCEIHGVLLLIKPPEICISVMSVKDAKKK